MKKYKLSDETKTTPWGAVLRRVVATTTFTLACGLTIKAGDIGGWIEKESNLSGNAWVADNAQVYGNTHVSGDAHVYGNANVSDDAQVFGNARVCGDAKVYGNAWVSGDAQVSGNARVCGNALVSDNACVLGNARIYGHAQVCGNARVYDNTQVYGDAKVSDNAKISGDAKVMNVSDYVVFQNDWSSDRYFTWTKSNDMWAVGCFYGTGDELIKKAYADNEDNGKHYEACVKSVKPMKNMEKEK